MSAVSPLVPLVLRGAVGAAAAIKALSNDNAVQYILSDIPFYTVGILALGAFTFFIFLRKITWIVLCLHVSVFLAFAAAILDLIQILFSDGKATSATVNTNPVLGLIIAREFLYALSTGLRFLFLWGQVGCAPYGEDVPRNTGLHSGSWRRWGILGILLQWKLMVVIFAMTTLQILYRVQPALQHYGPVYQTEGTMEIVVSSIFILKLFMNSYLAGLASFGERSGWRTLFHYTPLICALAVNIGIGVGNLLEFLFSETVLGRFLQAVDIYILVLYVLVSSFMPLRYAPLPPQGRERRSSFQALPPVLSRDSSFRIPPPRVSTPDLAAALQSRAASLQQAGRTSSERAISADSDKRPSLSARESIARLSTWLDPRRLSRKLSIPMAPAPPLSPGMARKGLLNLDNAEKGMYPLGADAVEAEFRSRESVDSMVEPKESAKYQDPVYTSVMGDNSAGDLPLSSTTAPPSAPFSAPPRTRLSIVLDRPLTTVSSDGQTDSPIYGLNGAIRPSEAMSPNADLGMDIENSRPSFELSPSSPGMHRSSSLSGLLRQQEELDRSIAALKLFSDQSSPRTTISSSMETPKPSSAAQSDFSLSNFPVPPWRRSVDGSMDRSSSSRSPPWSGSPSANAARSVEIVSPTHDVRSQTLSLIVPVDVDENTPNSPAALTMNVLERSPELAATIAQPANVASTSNLLQLKREEDARPDVASSAPSPDYVPKGKSRVMLRPIQEVPSPPRVPLSLPLTLRPGASSTPVSRAGSMYNNRKLPVPPEAAASPSSIPGLAARKKIGLPSNPRPGDRRGSAFLDANTAYERPRPAPLPLGRPA